MKNEYKLVFNIANAIAQATGERVDRIDINRCSNNVINAEWYVAYLYTDKKTYLIRDDGTVDIKETKGE